jgi:MYXO-CTERM domain-containing protein
VLDAGGDAALDAESQDHTDTVGLNPHRSGGCGCTIAKRSHASTTAALALLAALGRRRGRRRNPARITAPRRPAPSR